MSLKMLGVFGDGMVLQHDRPSVHGHASPLSQVTVTLSPPAVPATFATTDTQGLFRVDLPAMERSTDAPDAYNITVTSVGHTVSAHGATFGTVILCSGRALAADRTRDVR